MAAEEPIVIEISPRVWYAKVAQEEVIVNEHPLPFTGEYGNISVTDLPSGTMAVRRTGAFQARESGIAARLGLAGAGIPGRPAWGTPGSKLVEATGSTRVWSGQCPAALLTVAQLDHPAVYEAGCHWIDECATRGRHYSHWFDPGAGEHYLGQGYQTVDGPLVGGGFSSKGNPSSKMPSFDGVEYGLSGWPTPTAQHLDVSALATFSLSYKSYSAMLSAIGATDAGVSQMMRGEYMPSRSFGWLLKSLAYCKVLAESWGALCPRTPAWYSKAIGVTLEAAEERFYYGAVAPDNGSTSEGGHVPGEISDTLFFVGIALIGATDAMLLAGEWEAQRLVEQCLTFMSSCRFTNSISGFAGFHDARAPVSGNVDTHRQESDKGVNFRFVLPGLERLRARGATELSEWIDPIVAYCNEQGWWGGKNDRGLAAAETGIKL